MDRIKEYLQKEIKTDMALAQVYDEKRLSDCYKYIRNQAKKMAKDGCAIVEDAVVYKWARDFFYGDTENTEETDSEVITTPAVKVETKKETKPVKKPAEIFDDDQPSLFDFGD